MFSRTWEKRAGMAVYMPKAIEDFMKTAEPVDGKRLLLVHGLGSEESWGFNRNGDGFPEEMEVDGQKQATLVNDDPSKNWGYHTFAKNAHTFRDHKNHDPKLSIGGKVVCAAWNPEMHRVELIIPVSERSAPDVVDAIDRNEKIAVSMGTKVPYDVCSICSNKAKHRGEYCKHARDEMNRIYSNGQKVGVHNPQPNFFDISVLGHAGQGRPADPSAYSLAKVASISSEQAAHEWPDRPKLFKVGYVREGARKAADDKKADIEKQVVGVAEEATKEKLKNIKACVPLNVKQAAPLPASTIISLRRADPVKVAATLTASGITLLPGEFDAVFPDGVPALDFSKISMPLFEILEKSMHHRSDWLSYFGDRAYRNVTTPTKVAAHGVSQQPAKYSDYLKQAYEAVSLPKHIKGMVQAIDRHPYVKSALARHDMDKVAKHPGLTAGNLVASMLGPMVLSAYFRSQQQMDPWSVGPVKGFVADHPLMSGAATALLWHKMKGGTLPLIGS